MVSISVHPAYELGWKTKHLPTININANCEN